MKYGIGIIGCGRISPYYIDAILCCNKFDLVATCDIINNKACTAFLTENITHYSDFNDLLRNPAIDCVVVALPNYLHKFVGIQALKCGKHLCMEKPTTISYEDYLELEGLANKKNLILYIPSAIENSVFIF